MKIIILAGGKGQRLWPLSYPPKQFSRFGETHSLLQKTILRFLKRYQPHDLAIVTQDAFKELTILQVGEIDKDLVNRIIIEPEPKNTAPAICFAIDWLCKQNESFESFLIAPSDHLIHPEDLFLDNLEEARKETQKGSHILFGVSPTSPQTGFGYIECEPDKKLSKVSRFIEKPPFEMAEKLLLRGKCLWNTGIVLFHKETFLEQMPDDVPPLSIDHALLESCTNLKVIPLLLSWSDLGSWEGVYTAHSKDKGGNVVFGDVEMKNVKNCLIQTGTKRAVLIDVEDLVIVDTDEGLLISRKKSAKSLSMFLRAKAPSQL